MSKKQNLLKVGMVAGIALGTIGAIGSCSADQSSTGDTKEEISAVDLSGFTPSEGDDIPEVEVDFGMTPFADYLIAVIGMKKGWFDDVGITLPLGETYLTTEESQQQLLNGQLEVTAGYVPNTIQTIAANPNTGVAFIGNIFAGNYVLAAPSTNAKEYSDFVEEGQDFEEAVKSSVAQLEGKRVAVSDEGVPRDFFNDILKLGELSPDDLDLQVIDDSKMVQLARSGSIDYAFPSGAAQGIQIMNSGFYRVVGIGEFIEGLPSGAPQIANAIGFSGLSTTDEWLEENPETMLRFVSVMLRILDFIDEDLEEAMTLMKPSLEAAAGENQTVPELVEMFDAYYEIYPYEEAAALMMDPENPLYYADVVSTEIEMAKASGVIPQEMDISADNIVSYNAVFEVLATLKSDYEKLASGPIPAEAQESFERAEAQYNNRNYLDAYRILSSAVGE